MHRSQAASVMVVVALASAGAGDAWSQPSPEAAPAAEPDAAVPDAPPVVAPPEVAPPEPEPEAEVLPPAPPVPPPGEPVEPVEEDDELAALSLEQLMSVEVVTASNRLEPQARAPGVVLRFSRQELEARGYTEVLDLLDDLPGMDVIRPWGDNYVKAYWRGYRTDVSFPFLVMIDGIVTNSVWTTDASHAVAVPMSMIDHIEVVYGPTSVVYGANAVMGVINIVTTGSGEADGTSARIRVSAGSYHGDRFDQRVLDGRVVHRHGDLRLSLAGRVALGWTDSEAAERFEYTQSSYADDPALWGEYLRYEQLARGADSPIEQYGLDARLGIGGLEIVARQLTLGTGYGTVYPTDRVQPFARWLQQEREVYASHHATLGRGLTARTLARVRSSGINRDSYYLQGFAETPVGGATPVWVTEVSYWQAINLAYSLAHDLDWQPLPWLTVQGGLKVERRDLARTYDVSANAHLRPPEVDLETTPLPAPLDDARRGPDRAYQDDYGAYLQGRVERRGLLAGRDVHAIHVGARADHNSQFGAHHSPTLRLGYVGELPTGAGTFLAKLLYGEAFHEPNPRQLYGGWPGSGSDIALEPESSRTLEINLSHASSKVSSLVSGYYVRNAGTIRLFGGGADRRGRTDVVGVDAHLQLLVRPPGTDFVRVWAYYSYLWSDEDKMDPVADGPIGDIASHKGWLGATTQVAGRFSATLRGRAVSARETVASNPIREVGRYAVLDATARVDRVIDDRASLTVRVDNLTGQAYSHPGIRTADGGEVPGHWEGDAWIGSAGYYNSRLPQPGRRVMITVGVEY
jgi:outer membrane receptor for ferrienterochelin and colicins